MLGMTHCYTVRYLLLEAKVIPRHAKVVKMHLLLHAIALAVNWCHFSLCLLSLRILPEHASSSVLVCCRVLLQAVCGRFQLVNQLRIEDVELVPLHYLQSFQNR